jgi:polysaccharide chain length determinant protein (PEP-CTERM system associated)
VLPGKRYTPDEILYILKRWRWLVLTPWVVIAIGTAGVARMLPDRYRSESVIQVVPPRVPDGYVRTATTTRLDARLPVITQQILSRTRLERIIQDFGLYPKERANQLMEDIVAAMRTDINVQIVKGDAFQVSYLSGDAKTAMKVTERLASLFVEENLRDREGLAEGANQFLESQLDEARRRLVDHEKKLEEYRRRYNGELPSQTQSNLQVISNTQGQLQAMSESINRDRDRRLMLERMLADADIDTAAVAVARPVTPAAPEPPAPPTAVAQLEAAKTQLHAMELRLKPEHPDIVRAKRTIRELEKKAEAEALQVPISAPPPEAPTISPAEALRQNKIRDLKAEMASLDRQIAHKEENQKKLQAVIGEYQHRVDALPTRESELIELTRDYDTLQKIYTSLLTKSEDAKVAANVERRQIGEQFKVIDPARLPEKPFSPDRLAINAAGCVSGLVLGLALVAALEFYNTSFRTDQDVVTVLALPVIATIQAVVTDADKRSAKRQRFLVACTGLSFMFCGVAVAIVWKFRAVLMWWR